MMKFSSCVSWCLQPQFCWQSLYKKSWIAVEEKAKVTIQIKSVFRFSYQLSWTFQTDPQPSPDHESIPCILGDGPVLNPIWIQEMWPPYLWLSVKEVGNWKLKLSSSAPETPSNQVNSKWKTAVLQFNEMLQTSWSECDKVRSPHTSKIFPCRKAWLPSPLCPPTCLCISCEDPYWAVAIVTLLRGQSALNSTLQSKLNFHNGF